MALMITDECIGCGVCLPECPHQAICEEDGNFWIRAGRCTECAEDPGGPHCRRLCPMPEVIVTNPRRTETREALLRKAASFKLRRLFEEFDKTKEEAA